MNEEQVEYRGYVFVNSALSSIQKGVQGAHAMVEVTEQYAIESNEAASVLHEWRASHKTLIFLEAGFHESILQNYLGFAAMCEKLDLPQALFVEDYETMNHMATAFAGVVPSTIYDIDLEEYEMSTRSMMSNFTTGIIKNDDPPEVELCKFLKQFHLAR